MLNGLKFVHKNNCIQKLSLPFDECKMKSGRQDGKDIDGTVMAAVVRIVVNTQA